MKRDAGGWYLHPFEIALSGYSGSGKTTLAERLIAAYCDAGRSIGFIKRDAHFFSLDVPGKDTYRVRESGAASVSIEDKTHSAVIVDHGPKGASLAMVQGAMASRDIVIVEGRKHSPLPKLVLLDPRHEVDDELRQGTIENLSAVIYPAGEEERAMRCAGRDIPVFCRDDIEGIVAHVNDEFSRRIPRLSAVVLLGGRSSRMGRDKGAIEYGYGVSAARRMADLVSPLCDEVLLSVRPGQEVPDDVADLPLLPDRFLDFGPAGGILTALYRRPERAWLVVSCDLPLLEGDDIAHLLDHRDPFKVATALAVQNDRPEEAAGEPLLPEPLCAVWEPRSRGRILSFFQEGVSCPRWMLRNGAVNLVETRHPRATFNANTPEEYETARRIVEERRPLHVGGGR